MKLPVRRTSTRNPLTLFNELEHDMRRMFDNFSLGTELDFPKNFAALDICDKNSHYVVSVDVPGILKKDINLEVKEGRLCLWGERVTEKKDGDYAERHWGRFERSIPIPADADDSKVEAHFENGVLSVAFPKTKEQQTKKISIKEGESEGIWSKLLGKKEN